MSKANILIIEICLILLVVIVACREEATPTATVPPTATATPTTTPAATPTFPSIHPEIWRPAPETTWQWQLTDPPVDLSLDVDMYDIDLFENDFNTVAALHARGRKVVCYMSAGSWEKWRPDADRFPSSVIGNEYEGWAGERWLDIRQIDTLAPVMRARLDQCRAKGYSRASRSALAICSSSTGLVDEGRKAGTSQAEEGAGLAFLEAEIRLGPDAQAPQSPVRARGLEGPKHSVEVLPAPGPRGDA